MDVSKLPTSISKARELGSAWYFTGKPCVRGHISHRYTSIGKCAECAREDAAATHIRKTDRRSPYKGVDGFISRAREVHGSLYDYSQVEYGRAHTKVEILCKEHGPFMQTPTNHLCGKGCPKCGNISEGVAQRGDTENFIQSARKTSSLRWRI